MALSVTRARVKEKLGIEDTAFDSAIDSIIAEQVPAIEYAVKPEHVADTGNTGLQSTLNVGAAEIVAGEVLAMLVRKPGYADRVRLGEIELEPYAMDEPSDPGGLKAQGWARLRVYLKDAPLVTARALVMADGGRRGEEE